jgi:hypothetical protein
MRVMSEVCKMCKIKDVCKGDCGWKNVTKDNEMITAKQAAQDYGLYRCAIHDYTRDGKLKIGEDVQKIGIQLFITPEAAQRIQSEIAKNKESSVGKYLYHVTHACGNEIDKRADSARQAKQRACVDWAFKISDQWCGEVACKAKRIKNNP